MSPSKLVSLAAITLSDEGWAVLETLKAHWPELECHRTQHTAALSRELFAQHKGLIYVMPTGVVLRALAPLMHSKYTDPAVVVLDVHARWAISLLSGHEGGANRLCEEVAWVTGALPIVTTTSEAKRTLIAGVGCRRNTSSAEILQALDTALAQVHASRDDVRLLASILLKSNEQGIHEAAQILGAGVRFLHTAEVQSYNGVYSKSEFVEQITGLPAVAEPCAMLAGSRPCLVLSKIVVGKVTIALARERLSWSELDLEGVNTGLMQ
jgi:cobalt-precorrin 5A hydrolase